MRSKYHVIKTVMLLIWIALICGLIILANSQKYDLDVQEVPITSSISKEIKTDKP